MDTMKDKTYTTREVARMLGVTVQTVQRWVDAGHLSAWRTAGGHRRLAVDSVEAFIRHSHLQLAGGAPAPASRFAAAAPAPAVAAATAIVPPVPAVPAPEVEPARGALTVLVVDDDEGDRELAIHAIRASLPDAVVLEADNGFAGLIQLGRQAVDVLVTDINMPHLDGLEMLRTVRLDPALYRIRIAAMSSFDLDEVKRRGGLPDGVAFLPKPLARDRVREFLGPLLAKGAA